jgi:glycosyltransferase involved in cell wall biosynthesis
LRSAKKVLTVSVPFRDQLAARGVRSERIEIIHNAISAEWGARARQAGNGAGLRAGMGIADDIKVVLIVGRLSREKDHLTLLEAVNRLRGTVMPHLVIVGDGPEKPRIEARVRHLGLDECVTFTGHRSSAEPWYGIADVAVLSSLSEGSPNALLEAMATNVPVVATAVGGVIEIVTHEESALLVNPGDPESMSAAIARLLTEPELADRLTKRSHELILERHEPESRTRKLVSIYRSLADLSSRSQRS